MTYIGEPIREWEVEEPDLIPEREEEKELTPERERETTEPMPAEVE